MLTAQRIFLVYGVVVLAYGFLLGVPLAQVRQRQPHASRYLVSAHMAGMLQGAIHLALGSAVAVAEMSAGWLTTGAWLLVAGSVCETVAGSLNWLTGTRDQFADKSIGLRFNQVSVPLVFVGTAIVAVGIIRGVV